MVLTELASRGPAVFCVLVEDRWWAFRQAWQLHGHELTRPSQSPGSGSHHRAHACDEDVGVQRGEAPCPGLCGEGWASVGI